jgi:peptidoglycan/xylan/chitin deacetylase (PgdA/CDA1 family)
MPRYRIVILLAAVLLGGCQTAAVEPAPALAQTCRFLLTYDDGPSASRDYNPTLDILRQLESNDVQPQIKALFFVQTRNKDGGGNEFGQAILRYQHAAGHVLGLHSGTERGHIRHTKMTPEELVQSLRDGRNDLRAITGNEPAFIRPTFWGYNDQTLDLYATHDLKMLLTDVNNRDGIRLHNLVGSRKRIRAELLRARRAVERGALPQHRGHVPVVVTFHDLNTLTAANMTGYLRILVEEARTVGLPLADKPFYDDTAEIIAAAALRAVPPKPASPATQQSEEYDDHPSGTNQVTLAEQVNPAGPAHIHFGPDHAASTLR